MARRPLQELAPSVLFSKLPGPTRKRTPSPYCYHLTYSNPQPEETGCLLMWEVLGGRDVYQVCLEREVSGNLRWHCSCADAVYRGDDGRHKCKHVQGLISLGHAPNEESEEERAEAG